MIRVPVQRNKNGSLTALGAAFALVLVVVGVGFFFFALFMGAQKETKNAVDAGTLNLGKKSLDDVTVQVLPAENQMIFWDVCKDPPDNGLSLDHTMSLRRINRVWAEAMLMKINAMAAQDQGQDNNGNANADKALQGAEDISNRLTDKLKDENNLHGFFTELAQQNNIRMIGNNAAVKEIPGANWQTSRMNEGSEGNVEIGGGPGGNFIAPKGFTWNNNHVTQTVRNPAPQGSNGKFFLKGYQPLTIGGNTYWQVPFQYDEKPHMVSKTNFESAKNDSAGWAKPVPNAFSAEGVASQPGKPAEKATSWVITAPRQTYKAAIPHSFVRIRVDKPQVNWRYFPAPPVPVKYFESNYGFIPENKSSPPAPFAGPLCATVTATNIQLGLDVVGRSLDQLIFHYPITNETNYIEHELQARCNEMITKVGDTATEAEVHNALSNPICTAALASGLTREFILYSPDGQNLKCLPAVAALPDAPWLASIMNNKPDGTEKQRANATGPSFIPIHVPQVTPDPFCVLFFAGGSSTYDKTIFWTPGSGYNGCLGDVRVFRETDVYSLGICTPII